MKVGKRRLVERSAPGPGRSPKADPRPGVMLYDGVEPIDLAGTIGVVMAARSAGDRRGALDQSLHSRGAPAGGSVVALTERAT